MNNNCEIINVREIVRKHLASISADGLFNADVPCGCGVDNLFPCEGNGMDCVPAKARVLDANETVGDCQPGEVCYFPITPAPDAEKED